MSDSIKTSFSRYIFMSIETLDLYFPWIVFFYGFLLVLMLENQSLVQVMSNKFPQAVEWIAPRRKLAWGCVVIGGLWSLQNMWF